MAYLVNIKGRFTQAPSSYPKNVHQELKIHPICEKYLRLAQPGVAFTGAVDFTTGIIYIHPLKRDVVRGNLEMNVLSEDTTFSSVGICEIRKNTHPIYHPNLSPQGRRKLGETSGHSKLCIWYGLKEDNCLGFAVIKSSPRELTMTINSRTLNSDKIRVHNPLYYQSKSKVLQRFIPIDKNSDGELNKEWSVLIANTLVAAFSPYLKVAKGSFESPY
ncbi:TPA: hypothetical protein ACS72K_003968 [Providencia alcalifaciens]